MSLGTFINRAFDTILPDVVGDMVGTFVDAATCNPLGTAANAVDVAEDLLESCGADGAARFADSLAALMGSASGAPEIPVGLPRP